MSFLTNDNDLPVGPSSILIINSLKFRYCNKEMLMMKILVLTLLAWSSAFEQHSGYVDPYGRKSEVEKGK